MRALFALGIVGLLCTAIACNPPNNGGTDNTVELALGDTGAFGNINTDGVQRGAFFDITADLPATDRVSATLTIDPADFTVEVGTSGTPGDSTANVSLLVLFAQPGASDPCVTTSDFSLFNITVDSNGAVTIAPESATVSDANFPAVDSGTFGLCIAATTDRALSLTISQLSLSFAPPGPVTAASCADVLALPEVQAALALLDTNGIRFRVPSGAVDEDLEGRYVLDQVTTFDPDESDIGDDQDGTVTLGEQDGGTITRNGFGGSAEFFLQGNATSIGFCALARTNAPACDQTVARLENLTLDADSGGLEGHFLAVAVRRHRFSSVDCGARGDFIYGTLNLIASGAGPTLATRLGKIELPDGFAPDLIALPPNGTDGVVTDLNELAALQFDTAAPFATTALAIPPTVTGDFVAAVGISRNNARVALAVATPPQVVTFERATGAFVRNAVETPESLAYTGNIIDFASDHSIVYVPGSVLNFANRVNQVRADNSNLPDVQRRLFTPGGFSPVHVRLNPAGTQLAVLMDDAAAEGEADLLTFVTLATGAFVTPALDIAATVSGTVLAHELVYSNDGERVFLAGVGAVLAVETTSPYDITEIDISAGAGDNPVALALSGDGEVLAVAIDDSVGDTDFAVIDTDTLQVLNTQDLPGIGARRALDIAHFATRRVAMVANFDSTVVAVQTESPYLADEPIRVADVQGDDALGRIVTGGDTIAVTNLDEPAIYVFGPPAP